jgi:hypothetical protein
MVQNVDWINLAQKRIKVVDCCEKGNELSSSVKRREFIDPLNDYQFLKSEYLIVSNFGEFLLRIKCGNVSVFCLYFIYSIYKRINLHDYNSIIWESRKEGDN